MASTVSSKESFLCGGKVNLFLKTERLNADGFHSILTLFLPFDDPADRLEIDFDAAPGIALACDAQNVPCDEKNLVWRAAQRYADAAQISPHWSIKLYKELPVAAGVGGGSADAGATLAMLESHYALLGKEKLAAIALSLGSDVPFFLQNSAAWATGRGEILHPIKKFPFPPLVLVNPGFPVSAKWAYTHLAPERRAPAEKEIINRIVDALTQKDYLRAAALLHNDLEYALFDKFPVLNVLRSQLEKLGALRVLVSGSGSSVFALMRDHETAENVAAKMNRQAGLRAWHLKEKNL